MHSWFTLGLLWVYAGSSLVNPGFSCFLLSVGLGLIGTVGIYEVHRKNRLFRKAKKTESCVEPSSGSVESKNQCCGNHDLKGLYRSTIGGEGVEFYI